jgi:hypothetical protein
MPSVAVDKEASVKLRASSEDFLRHSSNGREREVLSYIVGRLGDIGVGRDRHDEAVVVVSCEIRLQWMEWMCVGGEGNSGGGRTEQVEIGRGIVSAVRYFDSEALHPNCEVGPKRPVLRALIGWRR